MRVLVTGGAGFIGSNFIRYFLRQKDDVQVFNLDNLTYAGNLQNLTDVAADYPERYKFVKGDICDSELVHSVISENKINAVINFAAESHVDRSILSADEFVNTNIIGTKTLLDVSRQKNVYLFIQISTDEVYGSLGTEGRFTEQSNIMPNSPYSASKAAGDLLVRSYFKTYGFPAIITRCSNNYGPYQFPEKLIPLMINNAGKDQELPLYGDGKNIRDWIHVDDHSSAILTILEQGTPGEVYNIGGDHEIENIQIIENILEIMGKPKNLIKYVKDRLGHDKRYAMDYTKLTDLTGWQPKIKFEEGLVETVKWYQNNSAWVENVISKDYMKYYEQNYGYSKGAVK